MAAHERIAKAFSRARDYDSHAPVQRTIARTLASRIARLPLASGAKALEFGCGTGFLSQALSDADIAASWLLTDLSSTMVERCRAALGDAPSRRFATLDAEYAAPEGGPFDLICSSLALQWFDDARAALLRMAQWLAPGGQLMVTTLGPGTFAEWRDAHEALDLVAGTLLFTPPEAFATLPGACIDVSRVVDRAPDARSFVRAVKAIGAGTPHTAHKPLSPAELRAVLTQFERNGCVATYEVVTIHLSAPHRRETP